MKLEIRQIPEAEIRAEDEAKLRGYAAVYNSESVDFGSFREQIAPGAFARTLKQNKDIRALVDHDTGKVIGRTKSGTLSLREDEHGLVTEILPADTTVGRDIMTLVRRGDVDGMSFGFIVKKDKWEKRSGGLVIRTLLDVDLVEVSVVAFPAYPATKVKSRSADAVFEEYQKTLEQEERSWMSAVNARKRQLQLRARML